MEALLKKYRQLLSHLNSEEDELAEEFKEYLINYIENLENQNV